MLYTAGALALVAAVALARGGQEPLIPAVTQGESDGAFRVVTHNDHPEHSLTFTSYPGQIKSQTQDAHSIFDACPGATDGYTGYLNSGDKHFYFAYFESRSEPEHDPLLMWINGGPGCSSMTGLLMELGPCLVNEGGKTARSNEYSWTEAASVFFLDQPIGVGFSYSDNPDDHANGTFAASEDVYAFMRLWYAAFPEARSRPFSIAGESYGGHYIPIFASHIHDMNGIAGPEDQIPLESVLIGNGIFSDPIQVTSYYDISCTNATGIGPLLSDSKCEKMAASVERCEYLSRACLDYPDNLVCDAAHDYCAENLAMPYIESGRNFYDVSKPCNGPLCYPIIGDLTNFLRQEHVRAAFGVGPKSPKFESCSSSVGRGFQSVSDHNIDTRPFVTQLLHAGIRVHIYVGTYDWICNFVGNERVFGSLPWKGLADFRYQQENNKQPWAGGLWWESGPLRYARIERAGHMVPFDRGSVALQMVKSWLNKKPLH